MASGENKMMRRRLANAYLSSVISISLVLMLVGIASLLLINARSVSNYFKENMQVSVVLVPEATDMDAEDLTNEIAALKYVKSATCISKEQGTREMEDMLGSDFLSVFESSPIPASVDVTLMADYVSKDSLAVVKERLSEYPGVDDVVYQESLIEALNANLGKISLVLGLFMALLLFISFVLIGNTVRLSVYARRFTIHTMRLVGATKSFIRAPFIGRAVFQGLFAALLAIIFLIAGLFVVKSGFIQLFDIFRLDLLIAVMGIVIASGVLICMASTFFVVGKLVTLSKDELYY